ncbi:type IV pilin protein [Niveibacterium terrae]|uniref:type IV pilin protein n=1 Tax=Niveibacterium terrae TaxID=3373598 RepID=UPI003A8FE754
MRLRNQGFTLIELLIVVTIVGILSMIAYSAYQGQVERTRIGQLHEALMTTGNALERNVVANNVYPGTASPDYADLFSYTYTANDEKTNFALSGTESRLRLWSGINSAGTRCTCRQCSAPADTDFTAATKSCPAGTEAF